MHVFRDYSALDVHYLKVIEWRVFSVDGVFVSVTPLHYQYVNL